MQLKQRFRRFVFFNAVVLLVLLTVVLSLGFRWLNELQRENAVDALQLALQQEVKRKTGTLVDTLARNLLDPLYFYDFEEIGRLLQQTAEDADTRSIYLIGKDGALIHDGSEAVMAGRIEDVGLRLPEGGRETLVFDDHLVFYAPVGTETKTEGYVAAEVALSTLDEYQALLNAQFNENRGRSFLLIGLLLLLAVSGLTITAYTLNRILYRKLVVPVQVLMRQSEAFGKGQLEEPIQVRGDEEIERLGASLEVMRVRLLESIKAERRIAYFDAVTELPNRAAFQRDLHTQVETADPFTLLFFDLDDFKLVNDTLGHAVGDSLLSAFANRLTNRLEEQHQVSGGLYRLGGDEYVLIIKRALSATDIEEIGATCLGVVSEPFEVDGHLCHVGVSVGAAFYPAHGEDVSTLLQHADIAMYKAKRAGKNQLAVYHPGDVLQALETEGPPT